MNAADKTTAMIALAEALQTATLVGHPAPIVERLRAWMSAPLQIGDLAIEMSTKYRGPSPHRIGTVNDVGHSADLGPTVELVVLDAPCGNEACTDRECIHRYRWSNANFLRLPSTPEELAEACGGVGRDGIAALLSDAGIGVR